MTARLAVLPIGLPAGRTALLSARAASHPDEYHPALMAIPWLTAFKLIPWRDVVENAPAVLNAAKKLWDKRAGAQSAPAPSPDNPFASLQQEVSMLREEQRRAAELISSLAAQNERLVEAVEILRIRTRVLMYACLALAAALVALAFWR
jgi:hypothetical protein